MGKIFEQVWVPAAASFYFIVSAIFGLPYTVEVIGILAIIATVLGILANVDPSRYDGQIVVETNEMGGKLFSLELRGDPEELEQKNDVTFKMVFPPDLE